MSVVDEKLVEFNLDATDKCPCTCHLSTDGVPKKGNSCCSCEPCNHCLEHIKLEELSWHVLNCHVVRPLRVVVKRRSDED